MALSAESLLALSGSLGVALLLLALVGFRPARAKVRLNLLARVDDVNSAPGRRRRPAELARGFVAGVGSVHARIYGRGNTAHIERLVVLAGLPWGWGVADLLGIQVCFAVLGAICGLTLAVSQGLADMAPIMAIAIAGFGGLWPSYLLVKRAAARQAEIARDLPDVLDVLSLCLNAGMSLENAVDQAATRWRGPLVDEFKVAFAETRLGLPRREAFRRMAMRTDVQQLATFVAAFIQADLMGSSLQKTLAIQVVDARTAYLREAETRGREAPVKMLVPLTLFVLPALFIVLVGPAVPGIIRSMLG